MFALKKQLKTFFINKLRKFHSTYSVNLKPFIIYVKPSLRLIIPGSKHRSAKLAIIDNSYDNYLTRSLSSTEKHNIQGLAAARHWLVCCLVYLAVCGHEHFIQAYLSTRRNCRVTVRHVKMFKITVGCR